MGLKKKVKGILDSRFSIGGQFWHDDKIYKDEFILSNRKSYIFDGASSTIRFIIKILKSRGYDRVLLPSYLCPTIKRNFEKNEIYVEYYKINRDFSIDLNYLKDKIRQTDIKVVYIINYFGLGYRDIELEFFKKLRQNKILILEDLVHTLLDDKSIDFVGDFAFDSLRKFAGINGSRLFTHEEKFFYSNNFEINSKYINIIKRARERKKRFINGEINTEEEFLNDFNIAEREYQSEKRICVLPKEEEEKIGKLNFEYISRKRKENFCYLYDKLRKIEKIQIITSDNICNKSIPIGFIIMIENRDCIRKKLFENRIFCPILWDLREEEFINKFNDSKYISEHILMIPIDQRYNRNDYSELISYFSNI